MIALILALERQPQTLCAFTARLRVRNAAELMVYLRLLIALGARA